MNNKERAGIILKQLGGKPFAIIAGAHSFMATEQGLRFRVPRKVVDIAVKDDLYDITVYKTGCVKKLGREEGVYCDGLRDAFTRLTGYAHRL